MKLFPLLTGLLVLALSSCTLITSANIPGKQASKIPKALVGKYELQYPHQLADMMQGAEAKTYITFASDRMTVSSPEGDNTSMLGDSLFFSKIKKQLYLSMGAPPSLVVFKIVRSGKDLQLFPLFGTETATAADLSPYFSKLVEVPGEIGEDGEIGASTYEVTIDDKKLESFFKSDAALKDPFTLKPVKE